MMKRLLAAATVVVLSSAPALAGHCPKDVKAIDAALSKASLSSSQMSEVKSLRDNGSKLHGAKSTATLWPTYTRRWTFWALNTDVKSDALVRSTAPGVRETGRRRPKTNR